MGLGQQPPWVGLKWRLGQNRVGTNNQISCTAKSEGSKWSLTGSKKVWNEPIMMRQNWIEPEGDVATTCQCGHMPLNIVEQTLSWQAFRIF